jgi:hypothetical protein
MARFTFTSTVFRMMEQKYHYLALYVYQRLEAEAIGDVVVEDYCVCVTVELVPSVYTTV